MSFWGELKRRNVFKVGAAYVIVAWLIAQVASVFFPALHLPGWTVTLVMAMVIVCFPIILFIAWAFELTPDGVKRTEHVPHDESITHLTGRKLNHILIGVIVLAVAYILLDNLYLDKRILAPGADVTVSESPPLTTDGEEAPKTIAVLPFADLSPEKNQEYFVDGLSEELLNCLTKIPGLLVTARTSAFAFKGTGKTVQEIADVLGVENVLEGSVRKAGSSLRITAQLIRASDGFHLWSETYDRELKDIFAVQENIAAAVADELKLVLGIDKSFKQLGGTDNPEAYERYLVAQGQYNKNMTSEWDHALETLDSAIVLDPEFALAWALKALTHLMISQFGPVDRSISEQDAAIRASLKAIEIEPNLVDGHLVLYSIKFSRCDFIEAGYAIRKALELKTEPSSDLKFIIAYHYLMTGDYNRVNNLTEKMLRNDPLNQSLLLYYFSSFGLLGDMQRAEKGYERGKALSEGQWLIGDSNITMLRLGKGDALSRDDIVFSGPIDNAVKEHFDSPEEGLAELRRLYSDGHNLNSSDYYFIANWAAYFGDPEFALDATRKAARMDALGLCNIYFPVERGIRKLPQFKEFVREIGLVDYWNEFGWPDICQPLENGNFECD